jgi:hypothetical protein
MEIEIMFTVTTEYSWTGELTDLPAAVRKGGKLTKREEGETVLNEEELTDRLDDAALASLVKQADEQGAEYELQGVEEA